MKREELIEELRRLIKGVKPYLEIEASLGNQEIPRPAKPRKQKASDLLASQKTLDFVRLPETLEELEEVTRNCKKCLQLCKERKNVVFGEGNPSADLVFVGEAPGYEEDRQGLPFVGRAGALLTKMIEAMGMRRRDVYIANVLKCHPPGNRNPLPSEIAQCLPFLRKQLEILKPKVIVALGSIAARALLQTNLPIGQMRGKVFNYAGTRLLATYHPAYLLRNPYDKPKVWNDLKKVMEILRLESERKR